MTLTAAAFGMLALSAQIGIPVQDMPGNRASASRPLGEPVSARSVRAAPAPVPAEIVLPGVAAPVPAPVPALRGEARWDAGPVADRLSAADLLWIERTAAELTLEEKVGQLVVSYLEGGRPDEGGARWKRATRLVAEQKVGGFIVGVGPGYGTARFLNELQSRSAVPLLMTADLEWGPGTRLKGATVLPINMAVAAAGSASMAYEAGRITALEARAAGIHMAFAPVADVNVNPQNPVINTRSYGSDPDQVSDRVVAFIEGARSAGLLTVVKHFPGHGDTETDSHLEMPVLDVDRFRLEDVELRPFRAAIGAAVDGVMTAHLAVPLLDPAPTPRPATLSPAILTGLLRRDLGFRGLVVTDALHMDGVKRQGRTGEVAVAAIAAGADILLMPPDEEDAIDAVVRAVRRGELDEAQIDASVRRVLAAKAAAGLNVDRQTNMGRTLAQMGRSDHEAWSRQVAERSMTLARLAPGALPMGVRDRTVLAVLYDDKLNRETGETFESALSARGARVITVRLSKRSDRSELDRVRELAGDADRALFVSFSRAVPWKGALGLPPAVAELAGELAAAGAPVVSFGDPYLLRQLPDAGTYLLAWSRAATSQEAAVRALLGEIPVTGRLPIELPPSHPVGAGVVVPSLPGITTLPIR